jgi:hypothetical protein
MCVCVSLETGKPYNNDANDHDAADYPLDMASDIRMMPITSGGRALPIIALLVCGDPSNASVFVFLFLFYVALHTIIVAVCLLPLHNATRPMCVLYGAREYKESRVVPDPPALMLTFPLLASTHLSIYLRICADASICARSFVYVRE